MKFEYGLRLLVLKVLKAAAAASFTAVWEPP